MNERDEQVAELYDAADDHAYENAAQLERERETYDALEACVKAGLDKKHLMVLARETGMTTFALKQSLKG